ncbi:MAG: IS21-like element helper ATPase IstB [Acidobacteriota bacterium]
MTREQTFDKLYSLKLHGLADALQQQLENPEMDGLGFEERLALLVDAQYLWRENRAYATRLRQAHLKMTAAIEDINYRHARKLDRSIVQSLSTCEWIRRHHNLTIIGASGLGKTYLCCAFLEKACREGFRAYYASASKFFRQLGMAWADGSFDRFLAKLARTDVLAIDDFGLVALTDLERRHLLEVLDDRTESRSTILTSQFPVENWHELVGSPTLADAIVERILANSHRIELEGETLRRLEAKEEVTS